MSKKKSKDLESEKQKYIQTAHQLRYDSYIIDKLNAATSLIQLDRIMAEGRKKGIRQYDIDHDIEIINNK